MEMSTEPNKSNKVYNLLNTVTSKLNAFIMKIFGYYTPDNKEININYLLCITFSVLTFRCIFKC
ncbi:hypothetical protein AVI51_15260 [Piscirickettsia salmonis]|uniref:Uncharacterized protein n=1 Tax=Piscirickettsia salmonis TaxID=1238 RepID=A0A9Q6LUF5_PISSA|nr:hypothetical protein KW89_922 [Piscirickettsia salmonis]APS44760.1 hypothetical protein AVI48_10545 [Piscirickettsia salmonis]APS48120.1 hypothetical protein AVI49_11150 [Piscirickettsia salmonis]APS52076.1 hypothetical protein AVI50_15415 [Piscirickettsia salmonis]APS55294.1 hypothetical protein AVI51_15260 [Piscirickettsia salmonis]